MVAFLQAAEKKRGGGVRSSFLKVQLRKKGWIVFAVLNFGLKIKWEDVFLSFIWLETLFFLS